MIGDHNPGPVLHSAAPEKSHVFAANPAVLRYVKALNVGAGAAWIHVFDATSLPANGTAPDRVPIPVASASVNGDSWGPRGTRFENGCVAALSSTAATLTLVAGDEGWFEAEVVR